MDDFPTCCVFYPRTAKWTQESAKADFIKKHKGDKKAKVKPVDDGIFIYHIDATDGVTFLLDEPTQSA